MNGVLLALLQAAAPGGPVLVDGFERFDLWSAHPADGVALKLASDRNATRMPSPSRSTAAFGFRPAAS